MVTTAFVVMLTYTLTVELSTLDAPTCCVLHVQRTIQLVQTAQAMNAKATLTLDQMVPIHL